MAFRIKALCGIGLLACSAAQPLTLAVRHGSITFTDAGVQFNSRSWDYKNIQRLELSPTEIRLRTYEDVRWQLGRDREFVFKHLAPGETAKLYLFLSAHLDQRFIARLPEPVTAPVWEAPAKMLHRNGGYNGELKIGAGCVVFEGPGEYASRTWRYTDLGNVSSSSPFELTLTSLDGETRFQLKEALLEDRYNDLWRRVTEANGLKVFQSQMESHHD